MNVWQYLDRNNHSETIHAALRTLRITQEEHSKILLALTEYQFVINYRAKSRFGCAKHFPKKVLELTSEYFTRGFDLHEDRSDDHEQTLLHEVAHIIIHAIRPDASSHGSEWKSVMRELGARPDRIGSGDFLTEARKAKQATRPTGKKHAYHCDRCDYVYQCNRRLKDISKRRHGGGCGGSFTHRQLR